MKLNELIKGVQYSEIIGDLHKHINNLSLNSKQKSKNSLFFCLKGTKTKGSLYVEEAINNGAVAICAEKKIDGLDAKFPQITQIVVGDVRKAMAKVCANFFDNPQKKLKIVGVTGTNGKSSTSFLIYDILKMLGKKVGVIGTSGIFFDNVKIDLNMTTPESINLFDVFSQMVNCGIEYCIIEVSAHAIYFDKIHGIDFAAKVLTNVKSDHLDFFKTQKNYILTKQKFFESGENFVINSDDKIGKIIATKYQKKSTTFGKNSDFCIKNTKFSLKNTDFDLIFNKKVYHITSNLIGKFNVYNLISALTVIYKLGLEFESVLNKLNGLPKIAGRIDCVYLSSDFNVIIDYAHTLDSLKNLIFSIKEVSQNKNIVVFGCPGERDSIKRFKMGELAGKLCDCVILTSDNPASENPRRIMFEIEQGVLESKTTYFKIENRKQAIKKAVEIAKKEKNVNVLVVGKGVEEYQIVGDKHIPYSDYQVVDDILKKLNI